VGLLSRRQSKRASAAVRNGNAYPSTADLLLPDDYQRNISVDLPGIGADHLHHAGPPDLHEFASRLARRLNATTIVHIGCGDGQGLAGLADEFRIVGIDSPDVIASCRAAHANGDWLAVDLSKADFSAPWKRRERVVVVCSDALETQLDPQPLLHLLAQWRDRVEAIIVANPDRERLDGSRHNGPPADPRRVQEWSQPEFSALLKQHQLEPLLHGHARDSVGDDRRTTQLALIAGGSWKSALGSPSDNGKTSVLAMIHVYNEADVILESVGQLLSEGVDVHVLDNWSTDGTLDDLIAHYGDFPGFSYEVFPAAGPPDSFMLAEILDRMDEVATSKDHEWIVHVDADEAIESPFPGLGLAESLELVGRCGYDTVDTTCVNFRPVAQDRGISPAERVSFDTMLHWEFGDNPGYVRLIRAWKRRTEKVGIGSSGGHTVQVEHKEFPINFILRHYPLRSREQGRSKAFGERRDRTEQDRREKGWHIQYEGIDPEFTFLWDAKTLNRWSNEAAQEWLPEMALRAGLTFRKP
jgi:hypothetical protein